MAKKFIALLIAAVMMFAITATAMAAKDGKKEYNLDYKDGVLTVSKNGNVVTSYKLSSNTITIGTVTNGRVVMAFMDANGKYWKVAFPEGWEATVTNRINVGSAVVNMAGASDLFDRDNFTAAIDTGNIGLAQTIGTGTGSATVGGDKGELGAGGGVAVGGTPVIGGGVAAGGKPVVGGGFFHNGESNATNIKDYSSVIATLQNGSFVSKFLDGSIAGNIINVGSASKEDVRVGAKN